MLQPISDQAIEEALKVSGITLDQARKKGTPPIEAMSQFESWILKNIYQRTLNLYLSD